MDAFDTIAAVSSAAGAASRIVVRLAGPSAVGIAADLSRHRPEDLRPGSAARVRLHISDLSVPSWLYVFRGPRSYTGDDVVEFHLPGNPVLARLLLDHLHAAGARPAEPGEFTARAFFNGRLDLAQAEGVAATISAGNERELAAARQLMGGELARRLRPVMDRLAETLALVEAGIDFSDEDVTFLSPDQVRSRAGEADAVLDSLLADSARFERLAHEPTAVLVGRPNAGKSTLLNALAGHARAVTSPVAGTTRDALSTEIVLRRGVIRLVDVAGLDAATGSNAPAVVPDAAEGVAGQMRDRALREIESADLVVLVHAVTDRAPRLSIPREPDLVVRSKGDLAAGGGAAVALRELTVSAVTGANLDVLRDQLDRLAFGGAAASATPALALNARHVGAVEEAREALARAARDAADVPPEVVALELRESLDALGRVLGAVTPDDLLGRIFSTFCIGK